MTRPSRLAKTKALASIEDVKDDEEFVCPPPLMQRLGLLRGTLPTKCSTAPVQSVGRGLLSLSRKAPLPSGDNETHATSRGSAIGHGRSSRIPKIPVILGSDESDECSSGDGDESDADNYDESGNEVCDFVSTDDSDEDESSSESLDSGSGHGVGECFMGKDGTVWARNPLPYGRCPAVNVMRTQGGLSAFGRRYCNETGDSSLAKNC